MEKSSDPVILNDKPIHCLMYADDIILLSTSAPGLQEKIGILGKFCDDWCLRDRPFNLKGGGGGGLWFFVSFRIFFSDNTRVRIFIFLSHKARIFFPEFNIRLYDKNSESDYFFFLHQNQNIFFSNIGNQNIFLEKNHNPPKLNGRSLTVNIQKTKIMVFNNAGRLSNVQFKLNNTVLAMCPQVQIFGSNFLFFRFIYACTRGTL